jgi:hypothetical protein
MNPESTPTPPPVPQAPPPAANLVPTTRAAKPVSVVTIEPMQAPATFLNVIEALLKHPGRLIHACQEGKSGVPVKLALGAFLSLSIFGLLLGSFSGGMQLWAAPLKITLGMVVAIIICFPSLYIFSALDGLNARVPQIASVLLGMVALTSLLLLGFAPVIWVFSTSTDSLGFMGFLALLFWIIGLFFGTRLLTGAVAAIGAESSGYLKVWIVIFTIVTFQMSTSLRPLIGTADDFLPQQKKFFLQHWLYHMDSDNPATETVIKTPSR